MAPHLVNQLFCNFSSLPVGVHKHNLLRFLFFCIVLVLGLRFSGSLVLRGCILNWLFLFWFHFARLNHELPREETFVFVTWWSYSAPSSRLLYFRHYGVKKSVGSINSSNLLLCQFLSLVARKSFPSLKVIWLLHLLFEKHFWLFNYLGFFFFFG